MSRKAIGYYYTCLTARMAVEGKLFPNMIKVESEYKALELAQEDVWDGVDPWESSLGCLVVYDDGTVSHGEYSVSNFQVNENHPRIEEAKKALTESGRYPYRGNLIRLTPNSGFTLNGNDCYDTLEMILITIDNDLGCTDDEDEEHSNQCSHCGQWFSDDDYSNYYNKCQSCCENGE